MARWMESQGGGGGAAAACALDQEGGAEQGCPRSWRSEPPGGAQPRPQSECRTRWAGPQTAGVPPGDRPLADSGKDGLSNSPSVLVVRNLKYAGSADNQ